MLPLQRRAKSRRSWLQQLLHKLQQQKRETAMVRARVAWRAQRSAEPLPTPLLQRRMLPSHAASSPTPCHCG
jgi:hypothetical protein